MGKRAEYQFIFTLPYFIATPFQLVIFKQVNCLRKISACLLWLLACKTHAQQHRFIPFSVGNGLSQNSVHCIFQDSDGLLWLGTQDGLNSFDGHNFTVYRYNSKDTNSLSDQFVLSITQDNKGFLWIGTRNGLNKLNRKTGKFTRYYLSSQEEQQLGKMYPQLSRSNKGEIYVGHGDNPAFINKEGLIIPGGGLLKKNITAIYDSSGRLWSIKQPNQLGYIEPADKERRWIHCVNVMDSVPSYYSAFLALDPSQILWYCTAGSQSDLYFYHTAGKKWLPEKIHFNSSVNQINITRDGTGWVSTLDGIYIVKQYQFVEKIDHTSSESGSLPAGSILCTYEDDKGNIWAGSAYSGFAYYHPAFDHFSLLQTSQLGTSVTSVADMNGGVRWLGTTNGLLKTMRGNSQQGYRITNSYFASTKITSVVRDRENHVWVAAENKGLYVMDANGNILRRFEQGNKSLEAKSILHLMCDSKGRVIASTVRGYYIFLSADKWVSFYQASVKGQTDSAGPYTLHAFEDSKKNIWLSKNMGIEVLDENLKLKFHIVSSESTSPINRTIVVGCTEDLSGNIWIATLSSGIYQYSNNHLTQYTTDDGLNSNVIYGIISDDKGRLWATTTSGMNVYDPVRKRFFALGSRDGLPAEDYVMNAVFKGKNGQILIGSSKGLITIQTDSVVLQEKVARAQVSDLKVDGESIDTKGNSFVLGPGYRTVGFEFSLKEALQPRKIIYQYQMKGFDEHWNTLQTGNTRITYSNLPFETLTMRVRAAYSPQDLANAPIEEFILTVQPAFWQTAWFRGLVVVAIISIISISAILYNRAQYRKRLQALQVQAELQQERTRISRDLHDNIGAYTSALIAGINQLKEAEINQHDIGELSEYAANIMSYLRETIWVLNHEVLTLTAFNDRLVSYAQKIMKHYPAISLTTEANIFTERELTPQVSLNLFRILQEALQNACRHAQAGAIQVKLVSDANIQFSVSDNGRGILAEEKKESYGLQNMAERAKDIGFTLTIESEKNTGTTITCSENRTYAV